MGYCKNMLIAVDQMVNTTLGGWPDETLSSRAYRWAVDGVTWPMRCIDAVARCFGDKDHCERSFDSERLRMQAPPECRT